MPWWVYHQHELEICVCGIINKCLSLGLGAILEQQPQMFTACCNNIFCMAAWNVVFPLTLGRGLQTSLKLYIAYRTIWEGRLHRITSAPQPVLTNICFLWESWWCELTCWHARPLACPSILPPFRLLVSPPPSPSCMMFVRTGRTSPNLHTYSLNWPPRAIIIWMYTSDLLAIGRGGCINVLSMKITCH